MKPYDLAKEFRVMTLRETAIAQDATLCDTPMIRAGQLLKIEVVDHVVMGERTETARGWTSLRELGYFY